MFLTLNAPKFRAHSRTVQSKTAQALQQVSTLLHRESNGNILLYFSGSSLISGVGQNPPGYMYDTIFASKPQRRVLYSFSRSVSDILTTAGPRPLKLTIENGKSKIMAYPAEIIMNSSAQRLYSFSTEKEAEEPFGSSAFIIFAYYRTRQPPSGVTSSSQL